MEENVATSIIPEALRTKAKKGRRFGQGLVWLLLILSLGSALDLVSRYFDSDSRVNKLIQNGKALSLPDWTLRAYKCPTFKSELEDCKQVMVEATAGQPSLVSRVEIPLRADLKKRIISQAEKPTLLVFSRILTGLEKEWLADRVSNVNTEWPSQAQLVTLSSTECEAKVAGAEAPDFDPVAEPQKMACFAQSRFSAIEAMPRKNKLEYFIAIGNSTDIGPARWPILLVENQHVHEVLSLEQLTASSVILWNLVSLLMPIFVIAFRFVFRGQPLLNTLSDYALWLIFYAGAIVVLQQSSFTLPVAQTVLSTLCILFEGVILAMLIRYAYCASSGEEWGKAATISISMLCALLFVSASAVNKMSPQSFLIKSHLWRDALGGGLGCFAVLSGFYVRQNRAVKNGHITQSGFQSTTDDFGTIYYFARMACVIIPLMIFGTSNFREIVRPTQKILKWEDLFFLPSQTALIAFVLGAKTRTSLNYGRNMKERLQALFNGVLNMQRALTPHESVSIAATAMREALPAAAESPFEFIESNKWSTEQFQNHIALTYRTLHIPLHGSQTYRGVLRFDNVKQDRLSEEEEHFLITIANALANHLETQEAAANLEKMHQASLRFVPRDFLRLLNSESLVDFNLGDHTEGEMSVMFADIRNFTQISEGMTPAQNFDFINSFLTQIGPIIRHHGGFIDKYIGDAIMALFPQSPVHAARCAVDMQIALRSFNDKWLGLVNQEVKIGCGIHYGPMVLGIVGYAERLSGTVMSDAVNLASRLESLTKQYNSQIVVSEDVLQHMSSIESKEFNTRMLDSVRVKGRNALVTIYEIVVPAENTEELPKAS
ncbi:MAG: adenylate/guanylate cyclase domain-containing protein [Silvanigrellaceae bacterium]